MKKLGTTLALLGVILSSETAAQVTLTLNIRTPMPSQISVWEQDPTVIQAIIINASATMYPNVRASFVIRNLDNNTVVGASKDNHSGIPRFTLSPQSTIIRNGPTLVNADAVDIDQGIKTIVNTTNSLPEGTYEICMKLLAENGAELTATPVCRSFIVVIPDPPTLINPANSSTLTSSTPLTFTWTPVFVTTGVQARYRLRIAPMFQGQTGKNAIEFNAPLFDQTLFTSTFFYSPGNPQFSLYPSAIGYAWQVQAVDVQGLPATRNEGRSEIFTFNFGTAIQPPTLIAPINNAQLKTKSPTFQWAYTPASGENIRFRLKVVEVSSGQTPQEAINNYPTYQTIIYGATSTSHTPSSPMSTTPGRTYAWQLQVLDAPTGNVLRASPVWLFTLDPLQLSTPFAGAEVPVKRPTFSWSFVGGTGNFYDIRVVQMPQILTPSFSLESLMQSGPYIYEKKNIDGAATSSVHSPGLEFPQITPPSDLPLVIGLKYVWQVIARSSPNGTVIATSEMRQLKFNPYQTGIPYNTQVNGKIVYRFAGYADNEFWPLANATVKLKVKYVLKNIIHWGGASAPPGPDKSYLIPWTPNGTSGGSSTGFFNNPPDFDKVLAIGKTDANGNFTFSFIADDSMGLVKKEFTVGGITGEVSYGYQGDLYRVGRIYVEAPHSNYYTNPETDIIYKPGETVHPGFFGLIGAYVRSYALKVKVIPSELPEQQLTHAPLGGMDVFLLRGNRPQGVPPNEGRTRPDTAQTIFGMEVIARGTTLQDGTTTFDRLVKNVGPNDKYYAYTQPNVGNKKLNYKSSVVKVQFAYPADKALFGGEYKHPTFNFDLTAIPQMPVVSGRVVLAGEGTGIEDAKVRLMNYAVFFFTEERKKESTPPDGSFTFPYLYNLYDQNGLLSGPIRALWVSKPGYKTKKVLVPATGAPLRPGEKWTGVEIPLEFGATVTGTVVDQTGEGVNSWVTIGNGPAFPAKSIAINIQTWKWVPASFTMKAEKLPQQQMLVIHPTNTAFFPETTWVVVNQDNVDLGARTVYRKSHKIILMVREETPGQPFALWPKIVGAKVKIKDLNIETTTDGLGQAKFDFPSDGSQFEFIITAPPGKYYLRKVHSLTHTQAKYSHFEPIGVKKATFVSGHVYVGSDKKPVNNARVFIDQGSASNKIETMTDASGAYLLPNVPIGEPLTVWATKPSQDTTFIGDSVNVFSKAAGNENVDFTLSIYGGMDITKLMGFPVEVQTLQESGGKVRITGSFAQFPSNPQFSVEQDSSSPTSLSFSQLEIKPGTLLNSKGIPIAQPASLPLSTNQNSLDVRVYSTFAALLKDQNIGIHLDDPGTGSGVIKGKVRVKIEQFNTSGSITGLDGFNLALPGGSGAQAMSIPAITASGSPAVNAPNGFRVVSESGESLSFSMNDFPATTDQANSFLLKDTVYFRTHLHTDLANVTPKDVNIDIGKVRVTKNGVVPIVSTDKITLKLDQWTIEGTQWSFHQSDVVITGGVLKTGKIDIPLKQLNIQPTALAHGDFNLGSLSVGGIIPLTVTASPVMNYDIPKAEWFLYISTGQGTPAAYMANLPGMEPGAKINFEAIRLTSKGFENFSPLNTPLTIYKVAKLTPDLLSVLPEFVELSGLSFTIPKIGGLNASIQYSKNTSGQLQFRIVPIPIAFATNGVLLKFGVTAADAQTQKLDNAGFRAKGSVEETGKFKFTTWLYHTVDSTSVWVETTPKQSLPIGAPKTSMQNISGNMHVANSDWTNFWFAGDLTGTTGITDDKKRLAFTVVGEITASKQELGVKNIPTPFGGMNWRYDFENSRLTGDMAINKSFGGLAIENGLAECVVDASGWYFIAGGKLKVPGIGSAQAALLFGDYPTMTQSVKDKFAAASYNKKLPKAFENSISGFLFSGSVAVPVIIPDIDIDLVILYAKFGVKAGADVRVWRGFDGTGTEYGIGAMAFVHAYLTAGSITCTEIGADARVELGFAGSYNTGSGTFSFDGCGGFSLGAHVTQKFWGCDFEGCGCRYTIFSEGFNLKFKALMHLDSGGGKSLNFATGTCSGN